jgi:hypothetical protein
MSGCRTTPAVACVNDENTGSAGSMKGLSQSGAVLAAGNDLGVVEPAWIAEWRQTMAQFAAEI